MHWSGCNPANPHPGHYLAMKIRSQAIPRVRFGQPNYTQGMSFKIKLDMTILHPGQFGYKFWQPILYPGCSLAEGMAWLLQGLFYVLACTTESNVSYVEEMIFIKPICQFHRCLFGIHTIHLLLKYELQPLNSYTHLHTSLIVFGKHSSVFYSSIPIKIDVLQNNVFYQKS